MLELNIPLILAAIGCLEAAIIPYVLIKRAFKTEKFIEISEELLAEITQNEEMQKKLYFLGGILGKGIIDGTGMQAKGGKMKWRDLAMQIAMGYLQGKQQPQPQGANVFGTQPIQ